LKVLIYTDLQAAESHERLFANPSVPLQRWRIRHFYKELWKVYQKFECEALWDLGDTTDDRNSLPIPTIHEVLEGLKPFPTVPENIKLIGNHEQFLRSTEMHVGNLFEGKFTVVPKHQVLAAGGTKIVCLSYHDNSQEATAWLAQHAKEGTVVLGHGQILGCRMNSGLSMEGIPKKAFQSADLTLFGHVHSRQEVAPKVFYVGSPFQQDHGEAEDSKYVVVLDLKTLELEWVELEGFPHYATVGLVDFLANISAESEDRLKVVLRNQSEAETFYAHPLSHRAVPIYEYVSLQAPVVIGDQPATVTSDQSIDSLLKSYLRKVPPSTKGILLSDHDMLSYGMEIVDSACQG